MGEMLGANRGRMRGRKPMRMRMRMVRVVRVLLALGWIGACAAVLGSLVGAGAMVGVPPAVTVAAGYVAAVTVPLCVVDFREHRLPDAVVLPGYIFAAVGLALAGAARGSPPWETCAVFLVVLLLLGAMASGGGLGMGDVKLGGMLALTIGACGLGSGSVVLAGGVAFVSAGAVADGVRAAAAVGDATGGAADPAGTPGGGDIPFGPFLLGGFWVAMAGAGLGAAGSAG